MLTCCVQGQLQLSLARQGLLGVVSGTANGPQVDVVQLAARAWTPGLVAPSVLEELMLAIAHRSRNGVQAYDANDESSCEVSEPSSRDCPAKCLPCYPLFSCLLIYCSVWMQAGRYQPLVSAK